MTQQRYLVPQLRPQFSSVAQSCPTLCDPMDCSMLGLPVHHQLPEPNQTHVHWVSDAIQPSHPAVPFSSRLQSFPASGSFPMSSSSHQVGKVLNWISQIILNPEEVWNFFEYNYYNYSLKGYLKNVYVYQCLFGKLTIAQYRFFERTTMKSWATDFQRSIVHLEKINSL